MCNFVEWRVQFRPVQSENRVLLLVHLPAPGIAIRRFPASFFASIFSFEQKAQFQAQEGSENAPKVEF